MSDRILAILLGASEFAQDALNSENVSKSLLGVEREWLQYLRNELYVPGRNILSLFDTTKTPQEQDEELKRFLSQNASRADVLLVYYAGHGLPVKDEYYFAVRCTNDKPELSAYGVSQLAKTLASAGGKLATMVFVEACFSASVLGSMQTTATGGCYLLCSSKADASVVANDDLPEFTSALLHLLRDGSPTLPVLLGPEDLGKALDGLRGEKTEFHEPVKHIDAKTKLTIFPNPSYGLGGFQREVMRMLRTVDERTSRLQEFFEPVEDAGAVSILTEDIQHWSNLRYEPLAQLLTTDWEVEIPKIHKPLVSATLEVMHRVLRRSHPTVDFELAVYVDKDYPKMIAYFDSNNRKSSASWPRRKLDPLYYVTNRYEVVRLLRREIVDDFQIIADTQDVNSGYNFADDAHKERLRSTVLYLFHPDVNAAVVITASRPNVFRKDDSETKTFVRAFGTALAADFELFTDPAKAKWFVSSADIAIGTADPAPKEP